jgi:putative membrane protein
MQKSGERELERLLILCVDRDNDIGRKTNTKTPIIGKENNVEAATKLILADPEEADANTMFEAIRLYDNLGKSDSSNELRQIVTITGSELGGVAADRKLVTELVGVLKDFQANSLILVTDGFSDEDIIPLVQSRIPVTSVRRVVVKHSEALEETAAVFSRYLKMLVDDPRYSKIALGLPGVLLIALGVLYFLKAFISYDITTWTWIIGLIIVGSYLFGKGYGLDKKILTQLSRIYSLPGLVSSFSLTTGVLLMGVSVYQAWSYVASNIIPSQLPVDLYSWLELIPLIVGNMISQLLTIAIIGICIIFLGRSIGHLLERDPRFWRTMALVVIFAWSWKILKEISLILVDPTTSPYNLILYTVIGIAIIVASGVTIHFLGKRYQKFFEEKPKEDNAIQSQGGTAEQKAPREGAS